jgi:Bacteriophage T4 gp5 C-terminal trimerisation domain
MQALFRRRGRRLAILVVAGLAIAGGAAYATIPDSGNVYTACMLNKVGTIRLIDPSLGSASAMGHCTSVETKISWHQQGQKGDPGVPGPAGKDGTNGVSPTVAQLASGDPHCAAGGAAITDAAGTTAYVCSGQDGKDFAGTFTSPNGQYSLKVDDTGIQITGQGTSITIGPYLQNTGTVFIQTGFLRTRTTDSTINAQHDLNLEALHDETNFAGHDRSTTIDHDDLVHIRNDLTETFEHDQTTTIHGSHSETVTGFLGSGTLSLTGSSVKINDGTSCQPAARLGDLVNAAAIIAGSATVCIGG